MNPHDIQNLILSFYVDLFGTAISQNIPNFVGMDDTGVSTDQWESLCCIPSMKDVKDAVFDIGSNKSPGPDGFGSLFFKDAWDVIHVDVLNAVTEFFENGKILKQANCTFVTVIPKVKNPEYVKDLRPISCCNTTLKIITKILADRIRMVLPDIISVGQGAFVPGRNLAHNSVVAQDLIAGYN